MALRDTLADAPGFRRGTKADHEYVVDRILNALPAPDRAALAQAIADTTGWPTSRIEQALQDEGYEVSGHTLRTYRRRRLLEARPDWPEILEAAG